METIGIKQLKEICEENGLNYTSLPDDVKEAIIDAYERGYERFYDED